MTRRFPHRRQKSPSPHGTSLRYQTLLIFLVFVAALSLGAHAHRSQELKAAASLRDKIAALPRGDEYFRAAAEMASQYQTAQRSTLLRSTISPGSRPKFKSLEPLSAGRVPVSRVLRHRLLRTRECVFQPGSFPVDLAILRARHDRRLRRLSSPSLLVLLAARKHERLPLASSQTSERRGSQRSDCLKATQTYEGLTAELAAAQASRDKYRERRAANAPSHQEAILSQGYAARAQYDATTAALATAVDASASATLWSSFSLGLLQGILYALATVFAVFVLRTLVRSGRRSSGSAQNLIAWMADLVWARLRAVSALTSSVFLWFVGSGPARVEGVHFHLTVLGALATAVLTSEIVANVINPALADFVERYSAVSSRRQARMTVVWGYWHTLRAAGVAVYDDLIDELENLVGRISK